MQKRILHCCFPFVRQHFSNFVPFHVYIEKNRTERSWRKKYKREFQAHTWVVRGKHYSSSLIFFRVIRYMVMYNAWTIPFLNRDSTVIPLFSQLRRQNERRQAEKHLCKKRKCIPFDNEWRLWLRFSTRPDEIRFGYISRLKTGRYKTLDPLTLLSWRWCEACKVIDSYFSHLSVSLQNSSSR